VTPPPTKRRRSLTASTPKVLGFVAVAGLAGVVVAGMALPVVGPVSVAARDSIESYEDLPEEFREPALPVRTRIFAADGTRIATVYEENRREVGLDNIAPVMQQAIVAIEDSRFYEHNGFDPRGAFRALMTNVGAGGVAQGGSTLTMQYVKNVLVTSAQNEEEQSAAREDTITRKLREIRYAMALEKRLTKEQILERYLNIAYFGARSYGVEAASQRYFSKRAKKLELVEAATLAGIVQQPSRFDPTQNPEEAQARRDVVLNRMAELGSITVEQAREAKALDIEDTLKPRQLLNGCTASWAPYFCDYAIRKAREMEIFGATPEERADAWRAGGYDIYTTLDAKAQKSATTAVMETIPPKDPSRKAVAIAMIEPGTGNVRALSQNTTWGTDRKEPGTSAFNLAVDRADGGGQGAAAGSTFKLFTLLAALEQGISPYTVIPSPPRKDFVGFTDCNGSLMTGDGNGGASPFTVSNSTSSGSFDMFRGAAYSVNTFFVELQRQAGLCETVDVAKRLGVRKANDGEAPTEIASFTLGSDNVSPLTMANAYATVSAHGQYCKPRVIDRVVGRDGNEIPVPAPKCKQAVSRNAADAAAAILTNVVDGSIGGRTGAPMSIGRDTTGKTGTINDNAAVWFAGSTPDLGAAVMVYDPRGAQGNPLRNLVINGRYYSQVFGSSIPGPVWKRAMQGALEDSDPVPMDLQNQWNLGPARSAGTPGQSWSSFLRTPQPGFGQAPAFPEQPLAGQ
jgi:membrane peptidoglycan carboxypeptidase